MIIGFTGTSRQINRQQFDALANLFDLFYITELHHGGCHGADESADDLASIRIKRIVQHPPINKYKYMGPGFADLIMPPGEYLERNKNIVNACDVLVAVPGEFKEQLRSGTWSTVRYARNMKKPIWIIKPDGKVYVEHE